MPTFGKIMILGPFKVWNVFHGKGDALFENGLSVVLPTPHVVTTSATIGGALYTIGPFTGSEELRVNLTSSSGAGGAPFSNLTSQARFRDGYVDGVEWFIDWEDNVAGDGDYNDSFTHIYADTSTRINQRIFLPPPGRAYRPMTLRTT